MRTTRKSLVSAAALGASAILLSGCTVSGGGWYGGTNAKKAKVTVGFDFSCSSEGITGEMSFVDRRTPKTSFVAVPVDCGVWTGDLDTIIWFGTYRPRPQGTGGDLRATFIDLGATGPSKGDRLSITLIGGAYDGYTFDEALDGGNVTYVED